MEHGLVGLPIVSSIGNRSATGLHCCALQLAIDLGKNRALSATPYGLHKGHASSPAARSAANAKASCDGVSNSVRQHLQLRRSVAGSHTSFRYCAPPMGNGIPIGPRMPWGKVHQQNCVVSSRPILRLHHGNQNRLHRWHRLATNVSRPLSSEAETKAPAEEMAGDSETSSLSVADEIGFTGVHHVGVLCENLERSLDFYIGVLGLQVNHDRPADKLPYRGSWLWVGEGMIHLMELPNPDPKTGRPEHGGRDRHACISISDITPLKEALDKAGIPFTMSKSGRPALFTRDPDANTWEFVQLP